MHEASVVHPSAIIDPGAKVGLGTKIWHFCHISSGAVIGDYCSLGQNVFVSNRAKLGNNVKIQNNVSIYDGVILEDDVFCGPSMVFTNVVNPRSHVSRKSEFQSTVVAKGATIGANATIVCGNNIGQYAMVGAGSVVTRDVLDYAVVVGNPARWIGWICACGMRLPKAERPVCKACFTKYRVSQGVCRLLEVAESKGK
jgi:UDP-2-acetamido-3-amino-2,3-dideoxy-glucuronate N-acetyltransferase